MSRSRAIATGSGRCSHPMFASNTIGATSESGKDQKAKRAAYIRVVHLSSTSAQEKGGFQDRSSGPVLVAKAAAVPPDRVPFHRLLVSETATAHSDHSMVSEEEGVLYSPLFKLRHNFETEKGYSAVAVSPAAQSRISTSEVEEHSQVRP